ncbi:MAG TPA: type II toxin-antitoxin system VapC family toxin [Candidatus Sulfotelmatobacter sp.]|nr:type II toxin-antitoxin system VapC family toxin [Candidatus Sulfotelmatobacter sp.]
MSRFVLDASVTLSWLIDRNIDPYAARVRQLLLGGSKAMVPALWELEIANGFITAERRTLLTASDTDQILRLFESVLAGSIEVSRGSIPIRRAVNAGRSAGLTAYDAAYLDLANNQQLPLATLDQGLAKAALKFGVTLLS